MSVPADQLSNLLQHPFWASYSLLATYLAFIRKKGPVLKKALESSITALVEINGRACKAIKRIRADWRRL